MTTEKSILLINNTVNGEFNPDNAEPEENETSIVTVEEEEKNGSHSQDRIIRDGLVRI